MNEKNVKDFGFFNKSILDFLKTIDDEKDDFYLTRPNILKVLEKFKNGEFSQLLGEAERVNRGVNKTLIDDDIDKKNIKSILIENQKTWEVEILVPGVIKDNLHVKIVPSLRTLLSCNDLVVEYVSDGNDTRFFSAKTFKERFELPRDIIIDSIKSEYKDGILTIVGEKIENYKEEKFIDIKINSFK